MTLVYERRGGGEPLVLLHGIGSRWQAFAPVLDLLAADFDVLAVDLPGFGASPPAPGGLPSIAALTDAVAGWLAEQRLEGAHVAGNSTGAGVALELAARGLVASATALAPIGFWNERERAFCQASLTASRAIARSMRPLLPALLTHAPVRAAFFAQYLAHPTRVTPADALADVDALIGAPAFEDVRAAFTGYRAPPDAADRTPVTIAWGAHDRLLLPRQARRAKRLLPRARHVLLPGAGHLMMSDEPEAVAAVIRAGARAPLPIYV